jgi:crotonobetainyl-CoA:carnitine CoA-transferase CaiB-like acyl-CoA transferase
MGAALEAQCVEVRGDAAQPHRDSVIDDMTGITGMLGLLGAIRRAGITGQGCNVDLSLFHVALHQLGYAGTGYVNQGHASSRLPRGAARDAGQAGHQRRPALCQPEAARATS